MMMDLTEVLKKMLQYKAVADACAHQELVEAELGKVGGKEDDLDGGDDNIYRSAQAVNL